MISSFDELVLKCVNEETKAQIVEAVRCYDVGSYRAAIVCAYVAVCFDLISKLHGLASGDDGAAKMLVEKLERLQDQQRKGDANAMRGLLEFERDLLEKFRDEFDFFGHQEFEELARLRNDRNRCAHPTFAIDSVPYAPPAELARLHIRNALTHVLCQPPKQGRAALASLRSLIASPYFPTSLKDAVERLRKSEIGTARDALIRGFVDELAFDHPSESDSFAVEHAKQYKRYVIALQAVIEIHREVALPRLVAAIDKLTKSGVTNAIKWAGSMALFIAEAAESVNDGSKATLKVWFQQDSEDSKGLMAKSAMQIAWWRDSALEALVTLTPKQLGAVTDPPPEMVRQAARLYAGARNWDQANAIASECANPLADRFSSADIELIFNAARNEGADLIGSHGFREFIDFLYDKNQIKNVELEMLIDKYKLTTYKRPA